MNIRLFDLEKDYGALQEWCKKREWPEISKDVLSNYGFLAEKDNLRVAACWLYPVHDSKVCWMAFPIANPDSGKENRKEALDLVFTTIHQVAKDMGYTFIFTTSNTLPIENRLKDYGYKIGDKNVNHYWGKL